MVLRLADSSRVACAGPFPIYRLSVPEVPCLVFPMNRDSVPDVPWRVPEVPCLAPLFPGPAGGGKTRFTRPNMADICGLQAPCFDQRDGCRLPIGPVAAASDRIRKPQRYWSISLARLCHGPLGTVPRRRIQKARIQGIARWIIGSFLTENARVSSFDGWLWRF